MDSLWPTLLMQKSSNIVQCPQLHVPPRLGQFPNNR